jgi:xanthine dehydrogenase YagR molybdenum-binding subunit
MISIYTAGRVINYRTARRQITVGAIWALGQAVEASEVDLKLGRFRSKNLAGYFVHASAEPPDLDVCLSRTRSTSARACSVKAG